MEGPELSTLRAQGILVWAEAVFPPAGGQRPSKGSMVWTGKPFDRQGQEARWQGDTSISDTFD